MQVNGFNQYSDFHISTTFANKTKKSGQQKSQALLPGFFFSV
jgi:hypothetical protein